MSDKQENTISKLSSEKLFGALWSQLADSAADWLQSALSQLEAKKTDSEALQNTYLRCSAMAKRKLGMTRLTGIPGNASWQVNEAARLLLLNKLLTFCALQEQPQQIKAAFKFGDECEQIAIIKGLSRIDGQGLLNDLAIATGRTNSLNLFSAIALNNDYAMQYYEQRAYQQLVLKALFMDLDIAKIVGLKQRHCPELSTLAMDLVKERLASDRQPPGSIWLAIDSSHLGYAEQVIYFNFNGSSAC
jgi:hypothetical protein